MAPTDAQTACFEAGIKFGSLYHQFAGTPISVDSAASLATAMEDAIENQPHCESVRVDVREDALESAIADGSADYVEFTGEYVDVAIEVGYEGVDVTATMALTDGYPLMALERVDDA